MTTSITAFQAVKASHLVERLEGFDPNTLATALRVESLIVKHGIVSEFTYWERVERVLNDLGYDYDEIFEVLER